MDTDIKSNRTDTEKPAVNGTTAEPQEVEVCVPGLGQDALYALHFAVSCLHLLRTERLFRVQVQISLGDEDFIRLRQLRGGGAKIKGVNSNIYLVNFWVN